MKFWTGLVFLTLWAPLSFLQAQTKPYPYQARVINPEVQVFEKPNFDSKVIATLEEGAVFDVSQQLYAGAFYRIRVQPGTLGYVSDADVKPLWKGASASSAPVPSPGAKLKPPKNKKENKESKEAKEALLEKRRQEKKKRPYQYTQFVGLQYASIDYMEDTMGDKRHEQSGFFGVKLSGPDLVVDGAFPTEVNFLFHSGAPSYYERFTGKAADGWIFLMNFLWESYYPQGKNALLFMGFGPMLRYSKFNVSLTDQATSRTQEYSLEDIGAGAVFNGGIGVRMDQVSLRGELQYYWEKQMYWGAGIALQFAF